MDGNEDDKLYTDEAQEIKEDEEDNEFKTESEGKNDGKVEISSKDRSFRSHQIYKNGYFRSHQIY